MCLFLKGRQVYPVPPSLNSRRPICRLNLPLLVFVGDGLWFSGEWGVEVIVEWTPVLAVSGVDNHQPKAD